uniref:Uncharacterized protein n=1 Tax=Glossina austeni TaxID=7395 RepID=A0A1A9UEQ2_GLOAU
MYGCMDVWMYGCMDVWMYGCMDVWMYGCMDVWMYEELPINPSLKINSTCQLWFVSPPSTRYRQYITAGMLTTVVGKEKSRDQTQFQYPLASYKKNLTVHGLTVNLVKPGNVDMSTNRETL